MSDPDAPSLATLMEEMEQIRQQNRHLLAHNAALRAQQGGASTSAAPPTSTPFVPQSQSLASVLNVSSLPPAPYDVSYDASSSAGQLAPQARPHTHPQSSVLAAYETALARDRQESLEVQRKLNQPLGPELVSTRPGPNGRPLHYLATHQALRLANDVFRHDQWSSDILEIHPEFRMRCEGVYDVYCWVRVQVTLRNGAYRQDVGAHSLSNQRDLDTARENAMKSAVSDGIKRALKAFGDRLGLCLYDEKYRRFTSNLSKVKMEYDASNIYRGDQFMANQKNPMAYGSAPPDTSSNGSSLSSAKEVPPRHPPAVRPDPAPRKPSAGPALAPIPASVAQNKGKAGESIQRTKSATPPGAAGGLSEGLEAQKAKAAREALEKRQRYQEKMKQEQETRKEMDSIEAKRKRTDEQEKQGKRVHSEPRAFFRGPPVPTTLANIDQEEDTIDTELAASQLASFFNDDLEDGDAPQSHTPTGVFREPEAHLALLTQFQIQLSPTTLLRELPSDWADGPGWGQAQPLVSYIPTPARPVMGRGKDYVRPPTATIKWRPVSRSHQQRRFLASISSSSSLESIALAHRVGSRGRGVVLKRRR